MNIYQAIALGVVQGITEFFPISSSGHLALLQTFFGLKEPQMAFDVFLHLGTLISIFIFFRKDIVALFGRDRRLLYLLSVSSVPTFIIGYTFKDHVEKLFAMPVLIGYMLILNGMILHLPSIWNTYVRKYEGVAQEPSVRSSIIIGIAQGIAVMPGISRSGSTIATGLLTGLERETAFRFSFLLAIPATLGAIALKSSKIGMSIMSEDGVYFIIGGVTAMVVGNFTIRALLRLVKSNQLYIFGTYCLILGALVTFLLF